MNFIYLFITLIFVIYTVKFLNIPVDTTWGKCESKHPIFLEQCDCDGDGVIIKEDFEMSVGTCLRGCKSVGGLVSMADTSITNPLKN